MAPKKVPASGNLQRTIASFFGGPKAVTPKVPEVPTRPSKNTTKSTDVSSEPKASTSLKRKASVEKVAVEEAPPSKRAICISNSSDDHNDTTNDVTSQVHFSSLRMLVPVRFCQLDVPCGANLQRTRHATFACDKAVLLRETSGWNYRTHT